MSNTDSTTADVEIVTAQPPSDDFRSIWTDLAGVEFQQGFIEIDGIRTRYLRSGHGNKDVLLLIPGTGGHAEVFAPNLGPLGRSHDCWAIDLVGHGYSDKPDRPYDSFYSAEFIRNFADTVGAERISIVGISVGVLHALRFAQRHPDRVDRLVLVTPFGAPVPKPGEPLYDFWVLGKKRDHSARIQAAQHPTVELARQIITPLVHYPGNVVDDIVAARYAVACQPGAPDAYKHVMWWVDDDLRRENTMDVAELNEIQTPALIFVGAEDATFVPMGEGLAAALPNSRMFLVRGAAHWPNYEDPGLFNGVVVPFLTGE